MTNENENIELIYWSCLFAFNDDEYRRGFNLEESLIVFRIIAVAFDLSNHKKGRHFSGTINLFKRSICHIFGNVAIYSKPNNNNKRDFFFSKKNELFHVLSTVIRCRQCVLSVKKIAWSKNDFTLLRTMYPIYEWHGHRTNKQTTTTNETKWMLKKWSFLCLYFFAVHLFFTLIGNCVVGEGHGLTHLFYIYIFVIFLPMCVCVFFFS